MVTPLQAVDIPVIIVAGTLGMLILAIGIILFVVVYQKKVIRQQISIQAMEAIHQKEMLEASIETQENERKRIAQDLHDDVGAMLSALKLGVTMMHRKADEGSELKEYAGESKNLIDEAITSVRRLSKELLPATLKEFGLQAALQELCTKLNRSTSELEILFVHNETEHRYDYKVELALFRVCQELINNAMKHAQAKKITVELTAATNSLQLDVTDDGLGFDLEAVMNRPGEEKGLGLRNIESRLSLVHTSTVHYDTAPGKGTHVGLDLKLD